MREETSLNLESTEAKNRQKTLTSTMVNRALRAMADEKLFEVYRKTQLPTSSTFHARMNATSPAIAGSRTNRLPLISRASFLFPGIAIPSFIPPGLYRIGIVPCSTAVEAPVGVKNIGMPAACAFSRPTSEPCGMSSSEILPSR